MTCGQKVRTARLATSMAAVALVTAASAGAAAAQQPLTLQEAMTRAVAHAPRLKDARARQAGAAALVEVNHAARRPSVSAASGYLRTNHVDEFGVPQTGGGFRVLFPDIPDNFRLRTEIAVPLFTGGRVGALVRSAEAGVSAAEADALALEADVALEAARAYWMLVDARAAADVLTRSVERADAWLRDVRSSVDAGVLPPNDLLSAGAQRSRQAAQLIQATGAVSMAESNLARLLGLDLMASLLPTTPAAARLPGIAEITAQPFDVLVARARDKRPERTGLSARQAAANAGGDAAGFSRRPHVNALAALEPARPNPRFVPRSPQWQTSWDLGMTATWLLFDGGRARAQRAVSTAESMALGHRLEEFDASMALEIRHRLIEISSIDATLTAASDELAAAAEARRVVEERFRAGVATSTDVLSAHVAQLVAELEITRLQTAQRLAEARLTRALGGT